MGRDGQGVDPSGVPADEVGDDMSRPLDRNIARSASRPTGPAATGAGGTASAATLGAGTAIATPATRPGTATARAHRNPTATDDNRMSRSAHRDSPCSEWQDREDVRRDEFLKLAAPVRWPAEPSQPRGALRSPGRPSQRRARPLLDHPGSPGPNGSSGTAGPPTALTSGAGAHPLRLEP